MNKDYQAEHIPGAINLPYPEFDENLEQVLSDISKDKAIAVICVKGIASKSAAVKLMEAGYENVKSIKGRMKAWKKEIS